MLRKSGLKFPWNVFSHTEYLILNNKQADKKQSHHHWADRENVIILSQVTVAFSLLNRENIAWHFNYLWKGKDDFISPLELPFLWLRVQIWSILKADYRENYAGLPMKYFSKCLYWFLYCTILYYGSIIMLLLVTFSGQPLFAVRCSFTRLGFHLMLTPQQEVPGFGYTIYPECR